MGEVQSEKRTIVIIGAGIFGVSAANHLARGLDLTTNSICLITVSDYVYFLPSAVRLTVSSDYSSSIMPLKDVIDSDVNVINDRVTNFDPKSVVLASGRVIEFAALVIATGSKWPDPIGTTYTFGNDFKKHFEEESRRIEKAEHILFIGGGFVNCEIIGEILVKYKSEIESGKKRISVIQKSDKLLPANGFYSEKLRSKVTDFMASHGVTLHLNTTGVQSDSNPNTVLMKGSELKEVSADLSYVGVGTTPNVPSNNIPDLCDKQGFIRVEKNFRVKACPEGNVFAIGDVADFRYHGIIKRDNWVDTLTRNVISYLNKGRNAKLLDASTFDSGHTPAAVSLGPNAGFGQLPLPLLGTFNVPTFLVVKAKSQKLFSEKMKSMFAA